MHLFFRAAGMATALTLHPGGAPLAGPPLSIDDPGILDPGRFEIIVASEIEGRDSGKAWLLPVLDVSVGLATDLQASAVLTRAVSDPRGEASRSDAGPASVGLKWRFLEREALQMSVAPFFETLPREGAAGRGVVEDVDAWVVPVQFQYAFAAWRVNAEVAYSAGHDAGDEWSYGVAAAWPLGDRIEALAELHGGADRRLDERVALFRVGIDVALSASLHVLASAGTSLDEPGDDDLDYQGYLGLQWFP